MYNLIEQEWIPVKRSDGTIGLISPYAITDSSIVGLNACRPDFNGALIEFLIGLVQTCMTPKHEKEWRQLRDAPPSAQDLKSVFEPVKFAFNLDGEGPRFMQDLTLTKKEGREWSVANLLLETPGDSTIENNRDIFMKRGSVEAMCIPCTATALYNMQAHAPEGGRENMTSLRGGGPLTTIVLGETLWTTIWNNVLELSHFGLTSSPKPEKNFPWLTPVQPKGKRITPLDASPYLVYWGMPRRYRLCFDKSSSGTCSLCNRENVTTVKSYLSKNRGNDYKGAWEHPLTPYHFQKGKDGDSWLSVKGKADCIGYRHWIGYVFESAEKLRPAKVVHSFKRRSESGRFRIWAFGYETDKMKVKSWCDGAIPVVVVDDTLLPRYTDLINKLILSAEHSIQITMKCVSTCIKGQEVEGGGFKNFVGGDGSLLDSAESRFWLESEERFYQTADMARQILPDGNLAELKLQWIGALRRLCMDIFDDITGGDNYEYKAISRRIKARQILRRALSDYAPKMCSILDLPRKNKTVSTGT